MKLTTVYISHDLSLIRYMCHEIAIMYLGKIVEVGPSNLLFQEPLHPYTQALISATPVADPAIRKKRIILKGDVSSPIEPPYGCPFHSSCFRAKPMCSEVIPEFSEKREGHWVSCHLVSRQ